VVNIKEPRDAGAIPAPATIIYMPVIRKKTLAQEFRKRGFSIGEIAQKLSMGKSGSISKWCRGIVLTQDQAKRLSEKQRFGGEKGRLNFLQELKKGNKKDTDFFRVQGINEVGKLSRRDVLIGGISMYWSEGYKYSGGEQVGFTNSDPRMIMFMIRWFKDICQIASDKITLQIRINKIHKDRIEEIEKWWSCLTGIPLCQFNKTVLINTETKKIYPNHNDYKGIIRITIRKSPKLRKRINGWIEALAMINNLPG
jgi:hypothetical protein